MTQAPERLAAAARVAVGSTHHLRHLVPWTCFSSSTLISVPLSQPPVSTARGFLHTAARALTFGACRSPRSDDHSYPGAPSAPLKPKPQPKPAKLKVSPVKDNFMLVRRRRVPYMQL